MNKTLCWYCEKEFEYEGEQYQDTKCPHCNVENSVYNPEKPELEIKEEDMTWKKVGRDQTKFLKFEAGKSFEGIYQGFLERENPFYNPSQEESSVNQPKIIDYNIEIDKEDKTLSSTAQSLKDQLLPLTAPCLIKIEMVQKGIKKYFIVWTQE